MTKSAAHDVEEIQTGIYILPGIVPSLAEN
jgi:hypothetical protein